MRRDSEISSSTNHTNDGQYSFDVFIVPGAEQQDRIRKEAQTAGGVRTETPTMTGLADETNDFLFSLAAFIKLPPIVSIFSKRCASI